jgi:hypothetical protein
MMLNMDTNIWTIRTQIDMNNHTGYTPSNLVNALLSVRARTANMLSVGFHIMVSHRVRKIQNMIRALARDKKIISARIFLFSVLFMLEKNMAKHIHKAISKPTK